MLEKTTTTTSIPTPRASQLGMPTQAAPIDRTAVGVALAVGAGVEAAGWWDVVKTVGSGLGNVGDVLFG